jgi:microcin C transport system substrate-binding protein
MKLSRRSVLRATASTFVAPVFGALGAVLPQRSAVAQTPPQIWRHGLSLFGDIKYPEGFKHFEYVNPNAPQGGTVRQSAFGTFDNFNMVVSGVKGSLVAGMELIYDTLTVAALDEVSTEYGLLAEAVSHPDDFGHPATPAATH